MAKLYSNENFPLPVVEELRRRGHDVMTIQEGGRASEAAPDDEVLRMATADGRAVLTHNRRDFIALHNRSAQHAGVIACTLDPDSVALAARIYAAIEATPALAGNLIRINRPQR